MFLSFLLLFVFIQVHNEGEMDRVLGIDGVQLIGINNRDLGISTTSIKPIESMQLQIVLYSLCPMLLIQYV